MKTIRKIFFSPWFEVELKLINRFSAPIFFHVLSVISTKPVLIS